MSFLSCTNTLTGISHTSITNERSHLCGICNKSFGRRDLRDRHKRRCAKASSRLPTTKRKSCLACARSKVRCDIGHPACSRCREKGKECQYTSTTQARERQSGFGAQVVPEGLAEAAIPMEEVFEGYVELGSARHGDDPVWDILNDTDANISDEWLRDIDFSPGALIGPSPEQPPSLGLTPSPSQIETWQSSADLTSLIDLDPRTAPELNPVPEPAIAPPLPPKPPSPSTSLLAAARLQTLPLIAILLDIPTAMVRAGTHAPFVHHALYDCSSGENVPTPIANAFCALKAYDAAVGASIDFVTAVLSTERARLARAFRDNPDMQLAELLAGAHAMCMYQTVGFFDGGAVQVAAARKRNGAFLGMARRLLGFWDGWRRGGGVVAVVGWQEWKVRETVARTVLAVHAINVLSVRQNGGVYEPLDDEAVLDLPLPCPGEVWKANTGVEWARARRKRGGGEVLTMRRLREDEMAYERFIGELEGSDDLEKFQGCDGLMKLILATA